MLTDALRFSFGLLTKEQLVDLAIILVEEGLSSANRKPKAIYKPYKSYKDLMTKKPDVKDLLFDTRIEAETALDTIESLQRDYGVVSVADVYEICGYEATFAEQQVGWTSVKHAYIIRTREGYKLVLPNMQSIVNFI